MCIYVFVVFFFCICVYLYNLENGNKNIFFKNGRSGSVKGVDKPTMTGS